MWSSADDKLLLLVVVVVVIRARARPCGGPIETEGILLLLIILFLYIARIFEGLNVLKKSGNFAHSSRLVKNSIFYGRYKGAWQNGSTAPPNSFQNRSPLL